MEVVSVKKDSPILRKEKPLLSVSDALQLMLGFGMFVIALITLIVVINKKN